MQNGVSSSEWTVEQLFEEFYRLNPSGGALLTEMKSVYLRYEESFKGSVTPTPGGKVDISVLVMVAQAIEEIKGYPPRPVQVMNVICFLLKDPATGYLQQINTGEGKTLIINMLAACLILSDPSARVDVITSSKLLAKRDAEESAALFGKFGKTVAHNIDFYMKPQKVRDSNNVYKADVLYGTCAEFAGDYLKDFRCGLSYTSVRSNAYVIVDEVDSMLVDSTQTVTKLADTCEWMKGNLEKAKKSMLVAVQSFEFGQHIDIENHADRRQVIDQVLRAMEYQVFNFSPFEKEMFDLLSEEWASSLFQACYELKENVHYKISDDKKTIKIIDKDNTGEILENSRWQDGLHEFLELKHGIPPTDGGFTSVFKSNFKVFQEYGPRLFGLTGTLGSESTQQFLAQVYKVTLGVSPTFKKSRHFAEQPMVCEQDNCASIVQDAWQKHQAKRPVLIIMEHIKGAKEVLEALVSRGVSKSAILEYIHSDEADIGSKLEQMTANSIVVATNLAGRGTDIDVSEESSNRGGLHVIIGFFPANRRVQQQAEGRSARKGQKGSARLILQRRTFDDPELDGLGNHQYLQQEYAMRDYREAFQLKRSLKQVSNTTCKDQMFGQFVDFVNSEGTKIKRNNRVFSGISEEWAKFLKKLEIRMKMEESGRTDTNTSSEEWMAGFDTFLSNLKANYANGRPVSDNPLYMVDHGAVGSKDPSERAKYREQLDRRRQALPGQEDDARNLLSRATLACNEQNNSEAMDYAQKAEKKAMELVQNEVMNKANAPNMACVNYTIQYNQTSLQLQNSLKTDSAVLPREAAEDVSLPAIQHEESMTEEVPQQADVYAMPQEQTTSTDVHQAEQQAFGNQIKQPQDQPTAASARISQSATNLWEAGVASQKMRATSQGNQQSLTNSAMNVERTADADLQNDSHHEAEKQHQHRQQHDHQQEKQQQQRTNTLQTAMQTKSEQLRNELKALREQVQAHNPQAVIETAKNEVLDKYRGLFTEIEKVKQVIAHNQKQTDEKQMLRLEEDEQARESETHTGVQTTRVVPLHPPEKEDKPQSEEKKEKGFLGYFLGAVSIVAGGLISYFSSGALANFGVAMIKNGIELIKTNWQMNTDGTYNDDALLYAAATGTINAAVSTLGKEFLDQAFDKLGELGVSDETKKGWAEIGENLFNTGKIKLAALEKMDQTDAELGLNSPDNNTQGQQGQEQQMEEERTPEAVKQNLLNEYDSKIKGNLEKISPHKLEQLIDDYKKKLQPTSERLFNQSAANMRLNAVHAGLLMQKHPDLLVHARARKALGDLVVNSGRISARIKNQPVYKLAMLPDNGDNIDVGSFKLDPAMTQSINQSLGWIHEVTSKAENLEQVTDPTPIMKDVLTQMCNKYNLLKQNSQKPGISEQEAKKDKELAKQLAKESEVLTAYAKSDSFKKSYANLLNVVGTNLCTSIRKTWDANTIRSHFQWDQSKVCSEQSKLQIFQKMAEVLQKGITQWNDYKMKAVHILSDFLAYDVINRKIAAADQSPK